MTTCDFCNALLVHRTYRETQKYAEIFIDTSRFTTNSLIVVGDKLACPKCARRAKQEREAKLKLLREGF